MIYIKGFLIGITMMIPGLSGGSCAMLLKEYQTIMNSISNPFKISNFIYLTKICSFAIIGILFFSYFLYQLTEVRFFHIFVTILIIINILLLLREYTKFKLEYLLLIVIGFIVMITFKKTNSFTIDFNIITYFIIGFSLAFSLILPGLGASYVLYVLDLYEKFNTAIITTDFFFLITITATTTIGILILSKVINAIFKKDKFIIYSLVIGFLIGGI